MSHLRDVVKPVLLKCVGVFIADKEPCIGMQAAVPAKNRASHRSTVQNLKPAWFSASCAVAVVLCPGDETKGLAEFVLANKLDWRRFHFYHPAETEVVEVLRAWRTKGLAVHSIEEIEGWGDLNQHFGDHWNRIAHDDHCKIQECRFH